MSCTFSFKNAEQMTTILLNNLFNYRKIKNTNLDECDYERRNTKTNTQNVIRY